MKINFTLILLLTLMVSGLSAQVEGISYTIAPGANYTWFNNRAGLSEAFMIGGRLGIGFGEFVELRGQYYQTIDGSIDFGGFELDEDDFDNTDVDIARYGAQLKLNLGRGTLLPYLIIGGGVQDVGRQGLDDAQNIYGTGGLGLTLSASDRFTFSIEGQYLGYRFNAVRNLLDQAERDLNNLDLDEIGAEDLGNFTVGANLAFYLGGRRPGTLSDIDRAYLNTFGNGIKGIRIPFEFDVAHVNFDNSLAFRDAWFAGLRAGLDFGPYVGLRAFYMQGMDENSLNFNFDDLAMYGLDLRLNLSRVDRGFTPFAILGGGRLNAQDGYVGRDDRPGNSQGFATAGLGLSFHLAKTLRLHGAYRILLTSQEEFGDIGNTDQLTSSDMFSFGLDLAFGKSAQPDALVENMVQDSLDRQASEYERRIAETKARNRAKTREMRNKYETRIAELEDNMNVAMESGNYTLVDSLRNQRDEARMIIQELENQEAWANRTEMNYLNEPSDNLNPDLGSQSSTVNTYGSTQNRSTAPNYPAQNNENSSPNLTLSFDQLLELVRASNPQSTTYVYPGGANTNRPTPYFRGPEPTNNYDRRERARPPVAARPNGRSMEDIRQELLILKQEQADAGNQIEAERYQRLIDETYRMQESRDGGPGVPRSSFYDYNYDNGPDQNWDGVGTPPGQNYQGGIYLGTDGNGRRARDLPNYPTPQPENELNGRLKTDPATMKKIRGFDLDAQQPDVLIVPEKQESKSDDNKKATKKAKKKTPSVPYEKDGSGR